MKTLSTVLALLGSISIVSAAPTVPENQETCSITNIDPNAADCSGYWTPANDDVDLVNSLNLFGSSDWQFIAKQDDTGITDPFNIGFKADIDLMQGFVSWDVAVNPVQLMFILKYANGFDAYNLHLPSVNKYEFTTSQDLSHATLYYTGGRTPFELPRTSIPIPGSLALLGLGLMGIGYKKRYSC